MRPRGESYDFDSEPRLKALITQQLLRGLNLSTILKASHTSTTTSLSTFCASTMSKELFSAADTRGQDVESEARPPRLGKCNIAKANEWLSLTQQPRQLATRTARYSNFGQP